MLSYQIINPRLHKLWTAPSFNQTGSVADKAYAYDYDCVGAGVIVSVVRSGGPLPEAETRNEGQSVAAAAPGHRICASNSAGAR